MQSWADIADSDEDSDVGQYHPANQVAQEEPEEVVVEEEEDLAPQPKTYNFPSEPPFTAYVGNLAFSVKDGDEMSQGVTDLLRDRFQAQVRVVKSRLAIDRNENRPRGFGYLEVETLEDLKTVMKLDDGQSVFQGRALKLDVAQPHSAGGSSNGGSRRRLDRGKSTDSGRSASFSEVDGAQFRGGRYNRDHSSSSLRRQSSVTSEGSAEPRRRPSLKLAPRSKPREEDTKESSASNLFGGGKARDHSEWERKRSTEKDSTLNRERRGSANSTGSRGGSGGRGGKGRGGGGGNKPSGRGSGGGRGKGKEDQKKTETPPAKEADAAPVTRKPVPQAPPEPEKPATQKVQNKFAALHVDSDSD